MTLSVGANWFVVVECVQYLALGPRGHRFLLADRAVHRESDEYFSHSTLLEKYSVAAFSGRYCPGIKGRSGLPEGKERSRLPEG
jgi:hypothetical protein